jgi:cytochrome c oxidase subunit 2
MAIFPRKLEEWYKPLAGADKTWIAAAIIIALVMATTTLAWSFADSSHQVPTETFEIAPAEFREQAIRFAEEYRGRIIPEGEDIYLAAIQWAWIPNELRLKAGVTYRIIISSGDVLHGFSLIGDDGTVYNLMVMPGMAYVMYIKFDKPGVYEVRCNEFCGLGHQNMVGRIIVEG